MAPGSHQVDVGIITILESEFEAIHRRLPPKVEIVIGRREYNLCTLPTLNGDNCSIALTRCLEQGNGEAQNAARDLLEDLDPQWLLVVGIAGGVPASELTLGDVVVSSRFHDFTLEAVTTNDHEYAIGGGPLHPAAARIVANLPARRGELGAWNSSTALGVDRPNIELRDDAIYGDDEWRDRVRTSLHGHFQRNRIRDPTFMMAPLASSDRLVKDTKLINGWLQTARHVRAIEMEAAGVYRAAWARQIPMLAVRGISDIVGFKRNDDWGKYACQSAASFTMAFLRLGVVPSRARQGRTQPPPPRYADTATENLCQQLSLARQRKERLKVEGQATAEVDREILQLRRELREGGQLRAGDALADGRFLLIEQVGRGGFAFVWRAFDIARCHDVAIKVLHANLVGDSLRLERFFRGARIMAELDHQSVVRVLAREGHELGFHYFVMEYVAGGNLYSAVLSKRITRSQILAVIYAVGDALAAAHARGYVHRDVKPENILLMPDLTARLTDFDLVGAADTTGGTRTGMLGTYIYAAPELLERPQDADARVDVHGLGMTLVFAIYGSALPHRAGRDPHRFIDSLDCSTGLKAILKHSIATERDERTPDIKSFCSALSGLPEVSEQMTTDLCTTEATHLLIPFIRFHEQIAAPPDVVVVTVKFLRHHHAGRIAEAAGDPIEAATQYRLATEVRPDHMPTLAACARVLAEAEHWSEHVDVLGKMANVVGDAGQKVTALLAAAAACEEHLRDLERALSFYCAVLTLETGHSIATTRQEAILSDLQRWEELTHVLLDRAERTTDLRDGVALLHKAAAILEDVLQDARAAFEVLEFAFHRDRQNPEIAASLARVATTAGQWQQFLDAITTDDGRIAALETLSTACANRGNWQQAAELLERAATGAPEPDRVRLLAEAGGINRDHLHQPEAAQAIFAEVIKLAPDHVEAGAWLAELAFQAKNWAAAAPLLEMLIRKCPPDRELYYRAARTADELGDHQQALRHYQAAYDLDSTYLPTLSGRADLLFKTLDYDNALKLYQTILIQQRDALDEEAMARIYDRLGQIHLARGEHRKARNKFEQALEFAPTRRETLHAMVDLQQTLGDWEEVIRAKRGLLVTSSVKEKTQILAEIASIYRNELPLTLKAINVYLEALEIAPEDFQLLQGLLDLYTETKQWKKAVETIDRISALEADPVRRATYHHAAAVVCCDKLKDLDRAVDYYGKALESSFAIPEKLSEAMIPRVLKSFDALIGILTTKRDWKALERACHEMIARLPEQGNPMFDEVRVGLFDALGEIYRSRLKQYQPAMQAYETAQQLDPHNALRLDGINRAQILAELYLLAGPDHIDKAVEQHMRMLRNEPFKYESYRALRRIYMDAHQYDKTWCVCNTLAFLKKADPDELQFYEQYKPRGLVKAKNVRSPDIWSKLIHPDENRYISSIFGACWQGVAAMKAFPHKEFGIKRKDKRVLPGDPLMFSKLFYYVAQVLNVPLPEVFLVEDNKAADIQLANAIEKTELLPSFVVRPHLLQGKSEREVAFLSARRLTFMRPEYYLKMLLPTNTELKVVVLSAIVMVQPRFPVPPDMVQLVQQYLPEMQKRTPPQVLEQLAAVVARFVQAAPEINLAKWGHAVDAVSHRAGFVVCGDLEVAARLVSAEPVVVGGPEAKDKIKELVLYSISEEFFTVRAQMGLTIAG